ncbi:hypothetical protein [Hydrogenophaga sp.]|uniref:hypothetical protein n=1 Tax=Hydrogenophaga sp. TaxID=1904254 RepID=UPI00271ECD2E|nr:hypothetical protein [Hydrogenophaga sp.]MDO9438425.1 hypothetical protein [Hydrogenophaga sp.]
MIGKLRTLFSRYPKDPGVQPASFSGLTTPNNLPAPSGLIAAQSVPDKFYFLLFGALRKRLPAHRAELVVVRAVSGAVGTGWLAEVKRSPAVAWLATQPWLRAYGGLFQGAAYRCANAGAPLQSLRDWTRANRLWQQLQTAPEPVSLVIDGIEVGDLLVDSYLRFKPSPEFDVRDPFVRRLIWQALKDVRRANAYFEQRKPKLYLTSYTTYLEHGIPARSALRAGVPVWSFGNFSQFGKRISLTHGFHTADFSAYRSTFESLHNQEEKLQRARQQLELRLSGGIDAATSYMRQSAYGPSSVALPTGLDGAVVVFLHDFYDSPHVYPDLVFEDFWRWICFTIDVLTKAGIPFFLKPHPNQIALSDEALSRLRQKYPALQWLPVGISNVQLAHAGITCGVTVYGTVAHELAYLGIPSIGCASHPHHTFDFCRTAHTAAEYATMLKTPASLPVPKDDMQRQALAFYFMHNLYGEDDARTLQRAFLDFWKACNIGPATEESVLSSFRALVALPAFDRFVAAMWRTS